VNSACPEGTRLWLTKRDEKGIFAGTGRMVERIAQRCRGRTMLAVLQSDCNSRGRMLFNRVLKEEIESRIQGPLCRDADVPWLGMYGGGELCPLGGRNRIHAFTSALYVLLRREA
jgi:small ligand-binding sensory domain FIST